MLEVLEGWSREHGEIGTPKTATEKSFVDITSCCVNLVVGSQLTTEVPLLSQVLWRVTVLKGRQD